MKTIVFEFESVLSDKIVCAIGVTKEEYIELLRAFHQCGWFYHRFTCPENKVRDAEKFFSEHNIKFSKVEEIPTDTPKHIYVKLENPLDCILLKLLPPIPLKSAEYRQIENKRHLEAFRCTWDEFDPVVKAFEKLGIGFRVY